jgi:multidrug resistance efflux pump
MAKSSKMTEAVVQDFEEHSILNVVVGKAVKISMKWNGKCYEGRNAGMDFESVGPTISKTSTGIRG